MINDELKHEAQLSINKIDKALDEQWLIEKTSKIKELASICASPDFWKQKDSKETLKALALLRKEVEKFSTIKNLKEELETMLVLYNETEEPMDNELKPVLEEANGRLKEWETERYLSDAYDDLNAFVSFSSGAGGVDAMDWTEMLLKMYLRWAERKGFETKILEQTFGDEAGVKSATVYFKGDFAYGLLKSESGVHRLVRISPFDANKRRHTSFALVEVVPELEEIEDIEIDEKDLKIEISRSSGHGGQNVQKVETAVRIVHIPTGITAECQDERSQLQNKNMALKVLKSRLILLEKKKQESKLKEIKGDFKSIEWGNEIRSYVLQPYKLVKDHRNNFEVGNVDKVLEGDIDEFIWAYLKSQKQ
ncbi:MAG: peptide chain release factor 2 [Caldisericaceae bacterium]